MAATRLIAMHQNKGKTVAQCLRARSAYAQDGAKTNQGEFISAYQCDPKTVDEEFLFAKRQYAEFTGRSSAHNVIAYQIRQSFRPGEITPEEANRVGYETALRFTKGKYAFLVATHTDRPHIHNYIFINSTSLDCTRKFRDFYLSGLALQRLSDQVCLEHDLSVIERQSPRRHSLRTTYPKTPSHRDLLCQDIDRILQTHPASFQAFTQKLKAAGYEYKDGKHPAVRKTGQQRFIRFRSLGTGYSAEELKLIIEQKATRLKSENADSLSLLIDIQAKLAQGKGIGYENWAKTFNVKQSAQAILLIQELGIHSMEELTERADAASQRFHDLSGQIKHCESRLNQISDLKKHIANYARYRPVFLAYKKSGYNQTFREEHRQELTLYDQARAAFQQLEGKPLPKTSDLNTEYADLLSQKKTLYQSYRTAREEQRNLQIAKKNIETLLWAESRKSPGQEKEKRELSSPSRS